MVRKPRGRPISRKLTCTGCDGQKFHVHTVGVPSFAYGNEPNDLFFVAEAPGGNEDKYSEPMVGSAGDIFWTLLRDAQLTECTIGNTIKCRPPDNRDPTAQEVAVCKNHTLLDIRQAKPKVVVFLGRIAAEAYLNKRGALANLRGWHTLPISQGHTVPAYVMGHPSALHYNPDALTTFQNDLMLIKRRLQGEEPRKLNFRWYLLDSLEKVKKAIVKTLASTGPVGFDWESMGLAIVNATPLTFTWCYGETQQTCFTLPFNHPQTPWTAGELAQAKVLLRGMLVELMRRKRQLTAHNSKFDLCLIKDVLDLWIPSAFCTMQGAHALDENRLSSKSKDGIFNLEVLTRDWLGISNDIWDDETSSLLYSSQGNKIDLRKLTEHASIDCATQMLLYHEIQQRAADQHYDLDRIRPLIDSLPYMLGAVERNGFPVDLNLLAELRSNSGPLLVRQQEILAELEGLTTVQSAVGRVRDGNLQVKRLFGNTQVRRGFAPSKRKHLEALYFDVLGIQWGMIEDEQTDTGLPRLDKSFFSAFPSIREVALVDEWKTLEKLRNTYLDGWWRHIEGSFDGRMRASFNGTGTKTGRLCAHDPNLQNIPKGKNPTAKLIKRIFRPHCLPGGDLRVIVNSDFSQAEVRWLAELSGEKVLIDLYTKRADMLNEYAHNPSAALADRIKFECDLHRATAAAMAGIDIYKVTKEERDGAKPLTFGNIYGITEWGLAAQLNISPEEALVRQEKWLAGFPYARDWLFAQEEIALRQGWVESPMGRRRRLQALLLPAYKGAGRKHLLNVARNSPIQAAASDMTLWVAIKMQRYVDKFKLPWKLLGLVHDSIIAEIPIESVLQYIKVLTTIAQSRSLLKAFGIPRLTCPMEMEAEVGLNYGDTVTLTTSPAEQEQVVQGIWDRWKMAA